MHPPSNRPTSRQRCDVLSVDEKKSVRAGSYEGVLRTKDYTRLEPGNVENKFYAKDIGAIYETQVEGPSGQLELIEMTTTEASPSPSAPSCAGEGQESS